MCIGQMLPALNPKAAKNEIASLKINRFASEVCHAGILENNSQISMQVFFDDKGNPTQD